MKKIIAIAAVALMGITGLSSCRSQQKSATVALKTEFDASVVWKLVAMRGRDVTYEEGQKVVTAQFNPESHILSGCSGCNQYFANYKNDDKGHLSVGEINGTKKACPVPFMKMERSYMPLLQKVNGYRLTEQTLELLQDDEVTLLFDRMEPASAGYPDERTADDAEKK